MLLSCIVYKHTIFFHPYGAVITNAGNFTQNREHCGLRIDKATCSCSLKFSLAFVAHGLYQNIQRPLLIRTALLNIKVSQSLRLAIALSSKSAASGDITGLGDIQALIMYSLRVLHEKSTKRAECGLDAFILQARPVYTLSGWTTRSLAFRISSISLERPR